VQDITEDIVNNPDFADITIKVQWNRLFIITGRIKWIIQKYFIFNME
jgi:hypothetical protein